MIRCHKIAIICWIACCIAAIVRGSVPLECISNLRGGEYRGTVRVTVGGRPCQPWAAQRPHAHNISAQQLPDASLSLAANFCRSPNFDSGGPWCYTTDPTLLWEYCSVPTCAEIGEIGCRDSEEGEQYLGGETLTLTNHTCRFWSDVVRHEAYGYLNYDKIRFPELSTEHNFCRNPNRRQTRPWCHSDTPDGWEFCQHIPFCGRRRDVSVAAAVDDRLCSLQGGTCATAAACCRDGLWTGGLCRDPGAVCCLTENDCGWKENIAEASWPVAEYALPMSAFGCPLTPGTQWFPGFVSLTTRGAAPNTWPQRFHALGPYDARRLTLNTCVLGGAHSLPGPAAWGAGTYCVLQAAPHCPAGFMAERLVMRGAGVEAETTLYADAECRGGPGVGDQCLAVGTCCRADGPPDKSINLPKNSPFYLLKNGDKCQSVVGMKVELQPFVLTLPDTAAAFYVSATNNGSGDNNTLFRNQPFHIFNQSINIQLCFYEPIVSDVCFLEQDHGFYYRGPVNVTSQGPCRFWKDITQLDYKEIYDHVGLEENHCRNTVIFEEENSPWCFSGGVKVLCDLPKCDVPWVQWQMPVVGRPARQKHGDKRQAQLVVDGNMATCSVQIKKDAWWQVDLQGAYEVHAVQIFRQPVEWCDLRVFDVYVSLRPDDFLTHGAQLCAHNRTAGAAGRGFIQCLQPVVGQYLTIWNLVHSDSEHLAWHGYEMCLLLCDVSIFAKPTGCGRPLFSRTLVNAIEPYYRDHTGEGAAASSVVLHSLTSWCPDTDWHNAYIQYDLLFPRQIQGLQTEGSRDGNNQVTEFRISYGLVENDMHYYEEYIGTQKLFVHDGENQQPQTHVLLTELVAGVVRLEVVAYKNRPCLRLELLGCTQPFDDFAHLGSSDQSSEADNSVPQKATDDDVSSCTETGLESPAWWRSRLPESVLVHSVVLQTGISFAWNLVARKTSHQKTTGWSGLSSYANDGNTGTVYWDSGCSHTRFHNYSWWLADMGEERQFDTLYITNRMDCCEHRLRHLELRVGHEFQPNSSFEALDFTDICMTYDSTYFEMGATYKFECDRQMKGRYVLITIPKTQYLTLCEVQVYGDRDPFEVSHCDGDCILGSVRDRQLCHNRMEVGVGKLVHTMSCPPHTPGLEVSALLPRSGPLSLCTVNIYGGYPAEVNLLSPGRYEVRCSASSTLIGITYGPAATNATEGQGALGVPRAALQALLHVCGHRTSCVTSLLSATRAQNDTIDVQFMCSAMKPQDTCQRVYNQTSVIRTPNFPFYYGADEVCSWSIRAPAGRYAALNITAFSLAPRAQDISDGCVYLNQGDCDDEVSVLYTTPDGQQKARVQNITLFLSSTATMDVNFRSCGRNVLDVRTQKLGMEGNIVFYECPGCLSQMATASNECRFPCAYIISNGFPAMYGTNVKTTWHIIVDADRYIELQFLQFDVFERPMQTCDRDYVEVLDYDLLQRSSVIGRYCNAIRPPHVIQSSWRRLSVGLVSDAVQQWPGDGFMAMYRQQQYRLPQHFPQFGNTSACPMDYVTFRMSCYTLGQHAGALTWLVAELLCQEQKGHLVSIGDHQEMVFLHYMLTTSWKSNYTETFIGLNDRVHESTWQWSDGSPLVYSDWNRGKKQRPQPDGADVEDCAMIRLQSVYSTNTWHDIPCAFDGVHQYLCERPAQSAPNNTRTTVVADLLMLMSHHTPTPVGHTFACADGELVLSRHVCDGLPHCTDGSDEQTCAHDEYVCATMSFHCDDGQCISMTSYCDYQVDCIDRSDESTCVYPVCSAAEWRCTSGQCVAAGLRCNLLPDCADGTDELNCETCAESTAFQCFDGTCISKTTKCDGVVDCPGSLQEDEGAECQEENIQASCLHWFIQGNTESGQYTINPAGLGSFRVYCDMSAETGYIRTLVHHDAEGREYVTGFEEPGSYVRRIKYYGASSAQLQALTAASLHCQQHIKVECFAANSMTEDWWQDVHGVKRTFDGVENIPITGCQCRLTRACQMGNNHCECANSELNVPRHMGYDEGYIRETSLLPMMAFTLHGSGFNDTQYHFHTIEPLECFQNATFSLTQMRCHDGRLIDSSSRCIRRLDQYGHLVGCRDAAHLDNCESFKCPAGLLKCKGSYCVPPESVCNGLWDCPRGQDEDGCGNHTCSGFYKCIGTHICLEPEKLCNSQRECPTGDDETDCDMWCPPGCLCYGHTFLCSNNDYVAIPNGLFRFAKKMDFTNNSLVITAEMLHGFKWLGQLILVRNNISVLPKFGFVDLQNLFYLDLSLNNILQISEGTFLGLGNVVVLNLTGNRNLFSIKRGSFDGLKRLPVLRLAEGKLSIISSHAFQGCDSLQVLDLSNNSIVEFEDNAFSNLKYLTQLNISSNRIAILSKSVLNTLVSLQSLQSDNFKYCCFVGDRVAEENCLPPRDEFSSCEDLMRRDVLKIFLWILGLMAFLCNGFVLVWRMRDKSTVYSFCVMNLAVADFFMGFYMVILAAVDVYFRGVYIEYAQSWKASWLCQVLGFINTLSSEASVFTLSVISADRFYKIVYPFKGNKFGIKQARYAMLCVWSLALLIALIPLFPIPYFNGEFYSRSSVCLSIYITNEVSPGWEYSVAVFHVLNFTSFMFIFISYSYIYRVVKASGRGVGKVDRPSKADVALARKLTLVVATDFLCWIPINIMGVAAMAGARISGEVYAWVVVFLLPVNSAINPVLYTISSLQPTCCYRKPESTPATAVSNLSKGSNQKDLFVFKPENEATLRVFLRTHTPLRPHLCMQLVRKLVTTLVQLHAEGLGAAHLELGSIRVQQLTDDTLNVFLTLPDDLDCAEDSVRSQDIQDLGYVITSLLRRCVTNDVM